MDSLFSRIGYGKVLVLAITLIFAYFILYERNFPPLNEFLSSLGYLGFFIAGVFYSSSFTAAPATAVLFVMADGSNIFIGSLASGLGALAGNLLMFKFFRQSSLGRHSFGRALGRAVKRYSRMFIGKKKSKPRKYFLVALAGIIIASPFPDEVGISILAKVTRMSPALFSVFSFALNTTGILAILIIGSAV